MYPLPAPEDVEVSAARPLVKRYHGLVRLAHWLNAIVLLGMITSGLQIYEAFPHFGEKGHVYPVPNPFDSDGCPPVSPSGPVSVAGSPAGSSGTSPSRGRLCSRGSCTSAS